MSTGGPAAPGPEREREDCRPAALPAARAAPSKSGRGTLGCYLQSSCWVVFSTEVHRPGWRCPPPRPHAARGASGTRAWARAGAELALPAAARDARRPGVHRPHLLPPAPPPSLPPRRPKPGLPEFQDVCARSRVGVQGRRAGVKTGAGRQPSRLEPAALRRVFCVCTHTARGGREEGADGARGRGERAPANGRAGGGAEAGRERGAGAGPSLPSIVCDWLARGAGAGRRVLGDSLGVSHLSIVFAAAAAPLSLSDASAASRSLSSSRRRRGVSFPICPLPRNRAPLAVNPGPGPGGAVRGPTVPLAWPTNFLAQKRR